MRGHRVELFDPGLPNTFGSCGQTGAGMLAPFSELQTADPIIFTLGHDSVDRWSRLVHFIDRSVFIQRAGTIIVSHPQDEGSRQEFIRCLSAKFSRLGIMQDAMQTLSSQDLSTLEPSLAGRFHGCLYLPQEGQIDNRQLMHAMLAYLRASPRCETTPEKVLTIGTGKLRTASGDKFFDYVVDCRGLNARDAFKSLRGVRGELIEVSAPDVQLTRPIRLMHPRYPVYVTPRENCRFLIGATSIESEDFRSISVQAVLELLSAAYSIDAGFADASILETRVNCRPALVDNLPTMVVGKNSIGINGLYRHGFLLAPRMASEAMDIVDGKTMPETQFGLVPEEESSIARAN